MPAFIFDIPKKKKKLDRLSYKVYVWIINIVSIYNLNFKLCVYL